MLRQAFEKDMPLSSLYSGTVPIAFRQPADYYITYVYLFFNYHILVYAILLPFVKKIFLYITIPQLSNVLWSKREESKKEQRFDGRAISFAAHDFPQ